VSGLLSFLPLHAAGHHDTWQRAVPLTVIDRAVSSYTPTIRALGHARRSHLSDAGPTGDGGSGQRMVVVAMPRTPSASDLPGAQAEAASLARRFADRATVLVGGDPDPGRNATRQTVSNALPAARWAHFACHGQANLANPSASCLLLADGPLTVVEVARLRLDRTELAFLSACETARPGDRLPDEAIHLASALQLAGYRHVVATLWPIGDRIAVSFAENFYTAAGLDHGADDVAAAVHSVTMRLRRRWRRHPSVWASHIHTGA
jgi:CHAT domain-containing protein